MTHDIQNCVIIFYSDKVNNEEIEEYVTDITPIKLLPSKSLIINMLNSPLNNDIEIIDHFGVKIKKLRICVDDPLSAVMAIKQLFNKIYIDKNTYIYLKWPLPVDYFEKMRIKSLKQWIYRYRLKKYKRQHGFVKYIESYFSYNGVIKFPERIMFNPKHNITHMLICITVRKGDHRNGINRYDQINIDHDDINTRNYVDKYYKMIDINNDEIDFDLYQYHFKSCGNNNCILCHKVSIQILRFYNMLDNIYYITSDYDDIKKWCDADHEFFDNFKYEVCDKNAKLNEKLIKYIEIYHRKKNKRLYERAKCDYLKELFDLYTDWYQWTK